jgi:hypothetical protein
MAQNNEVTIESLPLTEAGMPKFNTKSPIPGKVKVVDKEGSREVDGLISQTELEQKKIIIKNANIGRIVELYPGTKLSLMVTDAATGVECPIVCCLGNVVLERNIEYTAEYEDIPIEGWMIRDCSKLATDPNAVVPCYPRGIKTQKQLIEVIFKHESLYNSAFARWTLKYPEEIQERMDMEHLEARERALEEEKARVKETLAQKEKQLLEARNNLMRKSKEGK